MPALAVDQYVCEVRVLAPKGCGARGRSANHRRSTLRKVDGGREAEEVSCKVTAPPCSSSSRDSRSTRLALSRACVARRLPRTTISACPMSFTAGASAGGADWAQASDARASAPSAAPSPIVMAFNSLFLAFGQSFAAARTEGLRRLVLLIDGADRPKFRRGCRRRPEFRWLPSRRAGLSRDDRFGHGHANRASAERAIVFDTDPLRPLVDEWLPGAVWPPPPRNASRPPRPLRYSGGPGWWPSMAVHRQSDH